LILDRRKNYWEIFYLVKIYLPLINATDAYFTNIFSVCFASEDRDNILRYHRAIQADKINVTIYIRRIVCTHIQGCSAKAAVFRVNSSCFCYKNILMLDAALFHTFVSVCINKCNIIQINSIAPNILAADKQNAIIHIIFATTFGGVSVGDKYRKLL